MSTSSISTTPRITTVKRKSNASTLPPPLDLHKDVESLPLDTLRDRAIPLAHQASIHGQLDVLTYLVANNTSNPLDLFLPHKAGDLCIAAAAHAGHVHVLEFIVKTVIDAATAAPSSSIIDALLFGRGVSLRETLLPLHPAVIAAQRGHVAVLEFLVNMQETHTARPGRQILTQTYTYNRETLAHFAASRNRINVLEYLLRSECASSSTPSNVLLQVRDKQNWTPLWHAFWRKQIEAMAFLMSVFGSTPRGAADILDDNLAYSMDLASGLLTVFRDTDVLCNRLLMACPPEVTAHLLLHKLQKKGGGKHRVLPKKRSELVAKLMALLWDKEQALLREATASVVDADHAGESVPPDNGLLSVAVLSVMQQQSEVLRYRMSRRAVSD